jgi:arginyl-tRNA synthetase
MMGYDWADKLVHIPYGTISVAGVKLSTRHGNVLLLRDVFGQAIEKVRAVIDEKNPDLENKDATAEAVGVGAIIFHYLLGGIGKDSSFIMDDALSFDGNTGPYAQYTYARTCSVLEKVGIPSTDECIITNAIEGALVKVLAKFGETVEKALADYEPSVITRYILDVCAAFNRFYHECSIMNAENEATKATRVKLVQATNYVLGSALPLICLKTPEKV